MHNFAMVAAMTLYSVMGFFAVNAMVQGVKAALAKPGFNRKAFCTGFAMLTIGLTCYAFHSGEAVKTCTAKHSAATCNHSIK